MVDKKIGFLLLFVSQITFSQEGLSIGEMITDRPDETEAPNLVSKGYFQIETGTFYRKYENSSIKLQELGYNTTLLRYGLLENMELRLGIDYVQTKTRMGSFSEEAEDFTPLLLGIKIGIAEENGLLPQIGFIGHLNFPFTVSKEYRPENTGVDFRFAFSHELDTSSNLSYNLGAEWENDSAQAVYIYTLAYGYNFSDCFGLYVEVYGDLLENEPAGHYWDAGFTYSVKENLQLDVLVGTGIGNDQKLVLGGGLSYRLPK